MESTHEVYHRICRAKRLAEKGQFESTDVKVQGTDHATRADLRLATRNSERKSRRQCATPSGVVATSRRSVNKVARVQDW